MMGDDLTILAFIDIGLSGPLYLFMRLAAALGGLVAGWFLSGPISRLLYRIIARKPIPSDVLAWCKVGGAALSAFLIFYFLPLGSGGGGHGHGPGNGGAGEGKGSGTGHGDATKKGDGGDKGNGDAKRDTIAIELLGGDSYKDDQRYYLLDRKPPAVSLKEVDQLFQDKRGKLQVLIVLTRDSVGERHGAVTRLQNLARKYGQFTLVKTEMSENKAKASQKP